MKKELTQLERLDFAARAEVAIATLGSHRWCFSIMAGLVGSLGIISEASNPETLVVRVFAAVLVLGALVSWSPPRKYTLHAIAACYFGLVITILVFSPERPHSLLGWISRLGLPFTFASAGYASLRLGRHYARACSKQWQRERAQVQQWLAQLTNFAAEEQVFEIPSGSFWTGYFNYRFMRCEGSWIVARFKRGNYFRVQDYRVLGPGAIKIAQSPDLKLNIDFGKRKLAFNVSPDMRGSLPHATGIH